jgi:hypothetical protein
MTDYTHPLIEKIDNVADQFDANSRSYNAVRRKFRRSVQAFKQTEKGYQAQRRDTLANFYGFIIVARAHGHLTELAQKAIERTGARPKKRSSLVALIARVEFLVPQKRALEIAYAINFLVLENVTPDAAAEFIRSTGGITKCAKAYRAFERSIATDTTDETPTAVQMPAKLLIDPETFAKILKRFDKRPGHPVRIRLTVERDKKGRFVGTDAVLLELVHPER